MNKGPVKTLTPLEHAMIAPMKHDERKSFIANEMWREANPDLAKAEDERLELVERMAGEKEMAKDKERARKEAQLAHSREAGRRG